MTINFNVPGKQRKELAQAIATLTGMEARYMKVPTCAYKIGDLTLDKEGGLVLENTYDLNTLKELIASLAGMGFEFEAPEFPAEEPTEAPEAPAAELDGLAIAVPRALFTDNTLGNLKALVAAKGSLIKKALGVSKLPIEVTDEVVNFPWFAGELDPADVAAYSTFISKLCEMAINQKRVTAKEKPTDNEKYAFRCFLLRLGFIGTEFKAERKVLLRNLTGSSAFRSGQPKEVAECE